MLFRSVGFTNPATGTFASIVLPSGGRLMDDFSTLLGATVGASDAFGVSSTSPVQMVGLCLDETAWKVTPFLPSF